MERQRQANDVRPYSHQVKLTANQERIARAHAKTNGVTVSRWLAECGTGDSPNIRKAEATIARSVQLNLQGAAANLNRLTKVTNSLYATERATPDDVLAYLLAEQSEALEAVVATLDRIKPPS